MLAAIVENIVPLLPISSGTPPTHWNGSRYDVVLRFDRPDGATGFAFRDSSRCSCQATRTNRCTELRPP